LGNFEENGSRQIYIQTTINALNSKMGKGEMHCEGVGWIQQSQDRVRWVGLMGTTMNQQGFSEWQACFIYEPYLTYYE
jgi:hypothetical protein